MTFPPSFELCDQHPTIAFNKQDTHIIVHGKNAQHIIFQVINVIPNPHPDHKKHCENISNNEEFVKILRRKLLSKRMQYAAALKSTAYHLYFPLALPCPP